MLPQSNMAERRYSREEVDAILGRAVERERSADDLTHEQLVAIAQEVGVSTAAIERAITEVTSERLDRDELAQLRHQAWRGFFAHLIPYLCVNGLLVLLNYLTTRFPWAMFPILGWGIGLFSHLFAVAVPNRERLERRLGRQRERKRERELRLQAKRRIDASAKELEAAFTEGAAALLKAAANRISQGAEAMQPKPRIRVDERKAHDNSTTDAVDSPARKRNER
jgi:hypothetical protein